MHILVLDSNFSALSVLDSYESLLWIETYNRAGEFEIYARGNEYLLDLLQIGRYLWGSETSRLMIIEKNQINYSVEGGSQMIFSGRSLETILDRRIILNQTVIDGNLQNGIETLIMENAINPADTSRQIENLIFTQSSDPDITSKTIKAQFTKTNLYETVKSLCEIHNIGFRINLSELTNQFVFELFHGKDRSYEQISNPYVVFSPRFENIINSNYVLSTRGIKNVAIVAGEGEGDDRKIKIVGSSAGVNRREVYVDARDLSQTVDGVLIPEEDYLSQLETRGNRDLLALSTEETFDSQVDSSQSFKFGRDFFLGDIVQIEGDYGISGRARVDEIIYSVSPSGVDIYPKFKIV